jgi:hypothetical protein
MVFFFHERKHTTEPTKVIWGANNESENTAVTINAREVKDFTVASFFFFFFFFFFFLLLLLLLLLLL